jgi:hypothetical protein
MMAWIPAAASPSPETGAVRFVGNLPLPLLTIR